MKTEETNNEYKMEAANTGDGRLILDEKADGGAGQVYPEYHHKDHLRNTRLAFTDRNENGRVELLGADVEVTQQLDYYPFGLQHEGEGLFHEPGAPVNRMQYNGKEMIDGSGLIDYGARWYDPAVGRWGSIDPLADHPNQVMMSPFNYVWGNPIKLDDPDGRCPFCVPAIVAVLEAFGVGFAIGASADLTVQVATNKVQGKDAFEDFSGTSMVFSGFAGGFTGGTGGVASAGMRATLGVVIVTTESVTKQIVTDDAFISALEGDYSGFQQNAENLSGTQIVSDVLMDKLGGLASPIKASDIKTLGRKLDRLERINSQNTRPSRVRNIDNLRSKVDNSNNINDYYSGTAGNFLQNISDGTRSLLFLRHKMPSELVHPVTQDNTRVNRVLLKIE